MDLFILLNAHLHFTMRRFIPILTLDIKPLFDLLSVDVLYDVCK